MADPVNDLRRLAWKGLALLPRPVRDLASLPVRRRADAELRALAAMPGAARRLYLGPWNTAGQAWAWARAAEQRLPDTAAQNLWAQRSLTQAHFHYPADHELSVLAQRGRVREIHGARVLAQASHVLFESGRPVLADFHAASMLDDVAALDAAGVRHGVIYHGSEIRDLREHAQTYAHSPFRAPEREWDDYFLTLQSIVGKNRADLASYAATGAPVFVSTPDLVDFVPGATVLPLVVDVDRFAGAAAASGVTPLERARPVVLHAPSNPVLKGTAVVEEVLEGMQQAGLVEYRRLSGVPHAQMAAFVADADVVVDQVVLGNPGVLMTEALAAGRLVVTHLRPEVLARWPEAPPVVEADPGSLREMLATVLGDRAAYQELASRGTAWARDQHDGRTAAAVLGRWLDSPLLAPGG
ncbi:hypothetical protein [Ornithinimicrobium tianjinense]|uniref:Uncharacterized protein n=1 Tax=Ornithinimicrobium tianjinense TaxID=1195761 RepID=A0A917BIG7_9MICO|nr:hypothetical protein [Ornithinimicrobium tianjinense]GGF46157.1 hypothetical protein GCM10011366_12350 [Ornithinimicrobium tianjinense]